MTKTTTPRRVPALALRPLIVPVAALSAGVNVLMLTGSFYMLQVYDRVLSSGSVPTLVGLFVIVVALYAFLGLFDALRARLLSRAGLRLDARLGERAFRADLVRPGALRDLETLRGGLSSPAATAILDLPFVPLFLGLLFLLHPMLGWLTLAGAAVAAALAFLNRLMTVRATERAAEAEATERDFADGGRRALDAVSAMGMTARITGRWRRLRDRNLAASQAGSDPAEAMSAASRSFRMLLQSAILTLGAWLVIAGEISAGMIIASSILSGRALAPIDQIVGQWRMIGKVQAARRRLPAALAALPSDERPLELPDPSGRLEISGLSRLMPERPGAAGRERAKILDRVEFALEPGDGLCVIGASASGKTTLGRLLVGVLPADAGEVRLGGATLDQWSPERRGRFVGYLPQQIEMLPGTIRDNIARFDDAADDAAVIAAATLAGVHEMILRLPDGYGTRLTAAGTPALSGGQMQRIALARAVYGTPALVVLDEPNAHLDTAGEAALTRTIETLRKAGSIVVVMAHRKSALAAVNKLLLLEAGRVSAFGDKAELLDRTRAPAAATAGRTRVTAGPTSVPPAAPVPPAIAPAALATSEPATVRIARAGPEPANDFALAPARGKPPAIPSLSSSDKLAAILSASRATTADRRDVRAAAGPDPDRRPRVLRLPKRNAG